MHIINKIDCKSIMNKQNKKLKNWIVKNKNDCSKYIQKSEIPYINLSFKKLDTLVDAILKLGSKYILDEAINIMDTIPKIEAAIEKLPILL